VIGAGFSFRKVLDNYDGGCGGGGGDNCDVDNDDNDNLLYIRISCGERFLYSKFGMLYPELSGVRCYRFETHVCCSKC
jgi:hypothetical protein